MHRFQDLEIWKKSMDLAEDVYIFSAGFPLDERFGLTYQIRKSAVSVPSNIAEGAGRNGNREFNNFLGISLGSLAELETQTILAFRFQYISEEIMNTTLEKVIVLRRMIYAFQKKL
jgi:four helix bundle protein